MEPVIRGRQEGFAAANQTIQGYGAIESPKTGSMNRQFAPKDGSKERAADMARTNGRKRVSASRPRKPESGRSRADVSSMSAARLSVANVPSGRTGIHLVTAGPQRQCWLALVPVRGWWVRRDSNPGPLD